MWLPPHQTNNHGAAAPSNERQAVDQKSNPYSSKSAKAFCGWGRKTEIKPLLNRQKLHSLLRLLLIPLPSSFPFSCLLPRSPFVLSGSRALQNLPAPPQLLVKARVLPLLSACFGRIWRLLQWNQQPPPSPGFALGLWYYVLVFAYDRGIC